MKVLLINNKDSFVYILADYVARTGTKVVVVDNAINLDNLKEISPDRIIISPGPGHPATSTGNVLQIIQEIHDTPILGVCLGHQAIAEALGGKVERAEVGPRHGQLSLIRHDGKGIYNNVPNPFKATRYHSLAVDESTLPAELEISATADDNTIMGVRHRFYPIEGIQFHPESIMTKNGDRIIKNFLSGESSNQKDRFYY